MSIASIQAASARAKPRPTKRDVTRRTRRFGPPELAVDRAKRQRLVAGAQAWLYEERRHFERVRFDVIAWQVSAEAPGKPAGARRHIENACELGD